MAHINHWKLRRLARRALVVLECHRQKEVIIEAFGASLAPAASSYIDLYDALLDFGVPNRKTASNFGNNDVEVESQDAEQSRVLLERLRTLATKLLGWTTLVKTHVPSLRQGTICTSIRSPSDIIRESRRLIRFARHSVGMDGLGLRYAKMLEADLSQAINQLQDYFNFHDRSTLQLEHMRNELELSSERLKRELAGFRRVITLVLGPQHPHAKTLRVERSAIRDAVDDPELGYLDWENLDSADEDVLDCALQHGQKDQSPSQFQ